MLTKKLTRNQNRHRTAKNSAPDYLASLFIDEPDSGLDLVGIALDAEDSFMLVRRRVTTQLAVGARLTVDLTYCLTTWSSHKHELTLYSM